MTFYRLFQNCWPVLLLLTSLSSAVAAPNPRILSTDADYLQAIALSSDGSVAATAGSVWDGNMQAQRSTVGLWKVDTGQLLHNLNAAGSQIQQLLFTPDGKTLVASGEDGVVDIWEVASGRRRPANGSEPRLFLLAASPDGATLAGTAVSGTVGRGSGAVIKLWNLKTGKVAGSGITRADWGPAESIAGIRYLADGKALALALLRWEGERPIAGRVEIRDIFTGSLLRTITDTGTRSLPRSMSSDAGFVATCTLLADEGVAAGEDESVESDGPVKQKVQVWETATGKRVQSFSITARLFAPLLLSRDGRLMISTGETGNLSVWNVATGKLAQTIGGALCQEPGWMSLSHDASTLMSLEYGVPRVPVWKLNEPLDQKIAAATMLGSGARQMAIGLTENGKALLGAYPRPVVVMHGTARNHGIDVRRWDLASRKLTQFTLPEQGWVERLAFSPDGSRLAAVLSIKSWDGQSIENGGGVAVWDVATRNLLYVIPGRQGVAETPLFSPDGRTLALGGTQGGVTLWNVADGKRLGQITGQEGAPVTALQFVGTQRLAIAQQNAINIYDIASGTSVAAIPGVRALKQMSFSPDGKSVATIGTETEGGPENLSLLQVWSVDGATPLWGITEARRLLTSVAWTPDGKSLVVAGANDSGPRPGIHYEARVDVWDAELGVMRGSHADPCSVEGAILSSDGKTLYSHDARAIKSWDLAGASGGTASSVR